MTPAGTLVLEPVGGIAGDMCIAALLHLAQRLGREEELRAALDEGLVHLAEAAGPGALDLRAVRVTARPVEVSGIAALHVEVEVPAEVAAREPAHRPWRVIRDLLGRARLPEGARSRALRTFQLLAEAEGRVHDVSPEVVEFHEVGALDSIVDIAGVALLLESLAPARIVALPPPAGGGVGKSAHGQIPIPAPATLEVMRGRTLRQSGPGERTTPTGAALLAALTAHAATLPELAVRAAGYGAGSRRWDDAPNVLRAVLGDEPSAGDGDGKGGGASLVLEANLDDLSPQLAAVALEAALEAGALDAWIAPIVMKKGRPGHLIGALVTEASRAAVEQALFLETSTLGIRATRISRTVLARELVEVRTRYGPVRMKLGRAAFGLVNSAPEFEDCARAAREHKVPVKEVMAEAIAVFRAGR
jgi:pyridinium-3,5-bisthiocarboxylic acid mononucleotide nickel chelatase